MLKTWENIQPYYQEPVAPPITLIANGKQFYFQGEISFLINSIYYFFECVYIMVAPGGFRLVVIHHRQLIFDKLFKSLRVARIAFSKLFKKKAWNENVTPLWSNFYEPDENWVKKYSPSAAINIKNHKTNGEKNAGRKTQRVST